MVTVNITVRIQVWIYGCDVTITVTIPGLIMVKVTIVIMATDAMVREFGELRSKKSWEYRSNVEAKINEQEESDIKSRHAFSNEQFRASGIRR